MLSQFSQKIHKVSSGWLVLVTLTVFIMFTIIVLPSQTTRIPSQGEAVSKPDLSFFYTAHDLYRIAGALGEDGRVAYIKARFTFDVLWPIVYTSFMVTALSWLTTKVYDTKSVYKKSVWQWFNLLPLFGALFDYLENISPSIVMSRYPNQTAIIDVLSSVFTPLKWICITASLVLILLFIAKVLRTKIRST